MIIMVKIENYDWYERTFDNATTDYDESRPFYVDELYDDIFRYKSIDSSSKVLEIGIGTGKATLPILESSCQLTAIEPGERLAEFSKERFQGYRNFALYNQTLQEYKCPSETFDLIYAATSFHWIPEEYGYKRVYELLKKGGVFARFGYHAGKDKKRETLTAEIQEVYEKNMNVTGEPKEYCEEDAKELAEIAPKYGFVDTEYKLYHWTKDFSADEYMKLLRTYPNHMALEQANREKLFEGIHNAINRNGGEITIYYTMDLHLGRKM